MYFAGIFIAVIIYHNNDTMTFAPKSTDVTHMVGVILLIFPARILSITYEKIPNMIPFGTLDVHIMMIMVRKAGIASV